MYCKLQAALHRQLSIAATRPRASGRRTSRTSKLVPVSAPGAVPSVKAQRTHATRIAPAGMGRPLRPRLRGSILLAVLSRCVVGGAQKPLFVDVPATGLLPAGGSRLFNITPGSCSEGFLSVTLYDLQRAGQGNVAGAPTADPLLLMRLNQSPTVTPNTNGDLDPSPNTDVDTNGALSLQLCAGACSCGGEAPPGRLFAERPPVPFSTHPPNRPHRHPAQAMSCSGRTCGFSRTCATAR